jgi:hypothetical protein
MSPSPKLEAVLVGDESRRPAVREARLRPEHADRYPGIEAGIWFTAATLAEHLQVRRARDGEVEPAGGPRQLSGQHFEFRGGERPVGAVAVLGRRPGD